MIRFCFGTVGPAKATQDSNGQWAIEGLGGERYLQMVLFVQQSLKPYNSTFYLTTSVKECLQRLSANLSDISSAYIPIQTESPDYIVTESYSSGTIEFLTGYNTTEKENKGHETATVFSNVDLLEPEVYVGAFCLLISFIAFIIARIIIITHASPWTRKLTRICKEIAGMFYHSSNRFKLITLLYAILMFYVITSFLCLYKTSHVVVEKPFYPKTYQESYDDATSLAYLNDQFCAISDTFKDAPVGSIKHKLWLKLLASGEKDSFDPSTFSPESITNVISHTYFALSLNKSVAVTFSLYTPVMHSFVCSISPEDQLLMIKIIRDPMEGEKIFGPPMRKSFPYTSWYAGKFKRIFESHSMARLYDYILDVGPIIRQVFITTPRHVWRQKVVCENENAFTPDPEVAAIPLSYFASFLRACSCVWLFAFILNFLQVACHKSKHRRRTRHNSI